MQTLRRCLPWLLGAALGCSSPGPPASGPALRQRRAGLSLLAARAGHTAALLPGDQVLLVGGRGKQGLLPGAELVGPAGARPGAPSLLEPRERHCSAWLPSGRLLVVGGQGEQGPLASCELYDPATGSFAPGPRLLQARRDATITVFHDGSVRVAGGEDDGGPLATTEVLPPGGAAFAPGPPLRQARRRHAAARLPGGAWMLLGGDDGAQALATTELLPPGAGGFDEGPSMAQGRAGLTATLLPKGRLLVAGGDEGGAPVGRVEVTSTDFSAFEGAFDGLPRSGHTATLLPSGDVLLAGGASQDEVVNDAKVVRLEEPSLPGQTASLLSQGSVLLAGGLDGAASDRITEVFDRSGLKGASKGQLAVPRAWHTATLLPSGKVLIAGGAARGAYDGGAAEAPDLTCGEHLPTGFFDVTSSAELLDPGTGASELLSARMSTRRMGHAALLLPSGKVLLVGGLGDGGSATPLADLFDPETATFSPTAFPMARARGWTSATLLATGVLVAGGSSDATAELFDAEAGRFELLATQRPRPEPAALAPLSAREALLVGGDGSAEAASSERFSAAGRFAEGPSFQVFLGPPSALRVPAGVALICGGTCALFDPAASTLEKQLLPLASEPDDLLKRALLMPSTSVFFSGKRQQITPLRGDELLEIEDPLNTKHPPLGHSATLLLDGTVLLAGGAVASSDCGEFQGATSRALARLSTRLGPGVGQRPALAPPPSMELGPGGSVVRLEGEHLFGLYEASGGGTNSAAADHPALLWMPDGGGVEHGEIGSFGPNFIEWRLPTTESRAPGVVFPLVGGVIGRGIRATIGPGALGARCSRDDACASGHCADGVCCDSGCGGPCEACSAGKKGQGADGQCGPVAAGSDPDDECAQEFQNPGVSNQDARLCGQTGVCSGTGACARVADGAACDAHGVCSEGLCRRRCLHNAHCAPSEVCAADGSCVAYAGGAPGPGCALPGLPRPPGPRALLPWGALLLALALRGRRRP